MDFSSRYKKQLIALGFVGSADVGIPEEELSFCEDNLGITFPRALRDYYKVVGNLSELNSVYNRIYSPEDCEEKHGKLIFMEENQSIVYWGVALEEPTIEDPVVYQGSIDEKGMVKWYSEYKKCSDFLEIMLCWQAVNGGLKFNGIAENLESNTIKSLENWVFLGSLNGLRAYMFNKQAICVVGEGRSREIFLGAANEASYLSLKKQLASDGIDVQDI